MKHGLEAICFVFGLILAIAAGVWLEGCATAPVSRPIPLQVKQSPELGLCASSGYEVDLPPHTVATVASVCVRPYVAPQDGGAEGGGG